MLLARLRVLLARLQVLLARLQVLLARLQVLLVQEQALPLQPFPQEVLQELEVLAPRASIDECGQGHGQTEYLELRRAAPIVHAHDSTYKHTHVMQSQ